LRRLDHLATYLELHGERLGHYIEALQAFALQFQSFRIKKMSIGFLISLLGGSLIAGSIMLLGLMADPTVLLTVGGVCAGLFMILWLAVFQKKLEQKFRTTRLEDLDTLTPVADQTRKDSWNAIRDLVYSHLKEDKGDYTLYDLKFDRFDIEKVNDDATHEIREALSGFRGMSEDELEEWGNASLAREADKKGSSH